MEEIRHQNVLYGDALCARRQTVIADALMCRVLIDDKEIHPPLAEDEALGDLPQRNDRLFGLWRIEKHLGRERFFFFVRYAREDGLLREKFLF